MISGFPKKITIYTREEFTGYRVYSWMLNVLGLKGTEKDIFAIIYEFSRDDEGSKTDRYFDGTLKDFSKLTGASKNSVIRSLKLLIEKDLIIKKEEYSNGYKSCHYRYNKNKLKEVLEK